VRLLFDENLSPRLVRLLATEFPGSAHVREVGLLGAPDLRIWEHAREHGLIIVSKDNDFRQLSFLAARPPKVVWLDVGNDGTEAIAQLLRQRRSQVLALEGDSEAALLVLSSVPEQPRASNSREPA
jgi:predicted nuclease of predicted toxin-antitoxin system